MNDLAYVTQTTETKSETTTCPRCQPPVLCARHVIALTSIRRARTAALLLPERARAVPASAESAVAA